jgi:hypothetical protein
LIHLIRSRHLVYDLDYVRKYGAERLAGCAFLTEGDRIYHLKLNLLEPKTFFVVENTAIPGGPEYWVLSRLWIPQRHNKGPIHFQIGEGHRNETDNTIHIFIYDLNRSYEINADAEDYHFSSADIVKQKECS